jgi:phosphoglycolate phosphatase
MIVIFDWDGTLCDSLDRIAAAMRAAAADVALPVPSIGEVHNIVGLGLPQAVAQLFPGEGADALESVAAAYSTHYVQLDQTPASLYPQAVETLGALRERGFELAVATGKSRRGLNRVLAGLQMSDFFESTRCADETRSKPDPLMLEEILAERSHSPDQAVMVGDSEYDLDMAARAGIASVGVSFGVHDGPRLQRHGPVAIIDQLSQLLDCELLQR